MVTNNVPVKVQKRSGFDKSHHNALSQKIGTLVPILADEVIPNSKIYLRYAMAGSLPPLATDAYMKCYYDVRAFFVPTRLLYGGFEAFFSDYQFPAVDYVGSPTNSNVINDSKADCPAFNFLYDSSNPTDFSNLLGTGTLADYLGYKLSSILSTYQNKDFLVSALPFLAYHRIYNDWFRQPNISKEIFARPGYGGIVGVDGSDKYACAMMPFIHLQGSRRLISVPAGASTPSSIIGSLLADGVSALELRQVNYDYDYFTNALPSAQLSTPMSVNTSGGSFTIGQLRLANSLQQFKELNGLAGSKLVDVCNARYGANLSNAVAQRAVYLGGARIDIASKSVEVHTPTQETRTNPFIDSVGATAATAKIVGTDVIIDNFVANEPGYIMVLGVVIPKVTYGSGIRRYLTHYTKLGSLTDMACSQLQNIGNQEIYLYELTGCLGCGTDSLIFGWTDRYAEFMTMEDEVHGLMRAGNSLDCFVAQRTFDVDDMLSINSNFLTVPTTALNNVAADASAISSMGFYGQFAFEYKVSQPLAQYSMPSLQNPAYEHGNTVRVHRGGFRF